MCSVFSFEEREGKKGQMCARMCIEDFWTFALGKGYWEMGRKDTFALSECFAAFYFF